MNLPIKYNRQAAVDYARAFAYNRNPKYYDFERLGGDCTNFISQCLIAGGMPMNTDKFGWYYQSLSKRSPSFTSVEFLFNFLTEPTKPKQNSKALRRRGPVAVESDLYSLLAGDIIQLSFCGVKFSHSLLVVNSAGGEFSADTNNITIACHTGDAFNRPLYTYSYVIARGLSVLGAFS